MLLKHRVALLESVPNVWEIPSKQLEEPAQIVAVVSNYFSALQIEWFSEWLTNSEPIADTAILV